MPISAYYKGSGRKVMTAMKSRYGAEEGKRVFYATANSRKGMNRPGKKGKKRSAK